jgi:uncharacterized protein (TIGR00369 family)
LSFEELLKSSGGFKGLFELVRNSGQNLEAEVESFLKEEGGLFAEVGFTIKKISDDGYAELSFPFSQLVSRRGGIVHGGIISYALDTVGGLAAMTGNTGVNQVTLELKVNFLEPLRKDPFKVSGKVLRAGRTIAACEVEVRDAEETLCAKGLATYYYISDRIMERTQRSEHRNTDSS